MHTGLDGVTSGFEGVFHDASTNRLFVARALSGAAKVLGLSGSSEPAADDEGILGQLHSLLAAHRSVWHVLQEHWRLVLVTLTCF